MSLDERLTAAAHRLVDDLTTPDVDLDALRTQARANQRRNAALVVSAVVVAAAIGIGLLATGDGNPRNDQPPIDLPSPRVEGSGPVWYDDAGLHHGAVVQHTPVDLIGTNSYGEPSGVLALVRGGALYRDPITSDVWFHPWDAAPRVVGHGSYAGPGGDPEGVVAAWFEGNELVVFDTGEGREISRTEADAVVDYAGTEHVNGGNGFLRVSAEEVVWRFANVLGDFRVIRLDLTTGALSTLWEAQPGDRDYDGNSRLVDVRNAARVWGDLDPAALGAGVAGEQSLPLPGLEPFGRLSADGSFLLAPTVGDDTHGAAVVDIGTGETWNLWEPNGDYYAWISWAYGDVAVVKVDRHSERNGLLLACDAVKRRCDRLPYQGDVVLPTS